MFRVVLPVMIAGAFMLMGSAVSHAAATARLVPGIVGQSTQVQPAYYVWNHHRYAHRSWDKAHRRWHYY